MKYEMYQDNISLWRSRLKAANGEIIASGEAYHNKADCRHAIDLVKTSKDAPVYKI